MPHPSPHPERSKAMSEQTAHNQSATRDSRPSANGSTRSPPASAPGHSPPRPARTASARTGMITTGIERITQLRLAMRRAMGRPGPAGHPAHPAGGARRDLHHNPAEPSSPAPPSADGKGM